MVFLFVGLCYDGGRLVAVALALDVSIDISL